MIFNWMDEDAKYDCRKAKEEAKRKAQATKDEKWHKVFCWGPYRINPHKVVWLQFMVRRKNKLYWKWEYKTVPEYVKYRLENAPE